MLLQQLEVKSESEESVHQMLIPSQISNNDELENAGDICSANTSCCTDDEVAKHFVNEFSKRSGSESWRSILHGLKSLRELKKNKGIYSL